MTTKDNILANASHSYTFASHTSQRTNQSLQKSMPGQPTTNDKQNQLHCSHPNLCQVSLQRCLSV
jgi:hypothetical protein